MKTFNQFILEASNKCNKTGAGVNCPIHGNTDCTKKEAVQELEQGLKKLDNTSYDSIDRLMRGIMKKHNISAKKLHNDFVDKHDKTPDTWIKDIREATDGIKAKDYKGRLDKWFDDGGWVQTGGKYDGKPCAKQPGQTTKPYCRDPDDRATMDKDERNRRAAKKRKEDPNPDRKGKAKMVSTHESAGEKDACYYKVKSRYKVWPSAYASGALVKCRKKGAKNWGSKTKEKLEEQYTRIQSRGTTYTIILNWRGKNIITQMFLPQFRRPSKLQITDEIRKVYPNATVLSFYPSMRDPTQPLLFSGEKQ